MKVKLTFDDEEEGGDTRSLTPLPSSTHLKWGAGLRGGSKGGAILAAPAVHRQPAGLAPSCLPGPLKRTLAFKKAPAEKRLLITPLWWR